MSATAIIVLSDPQSGSDEALGRVFNALATAYEFKDAGDEVTVLFQGSGTRWIEVLEDPSHPAHALFETVRDTVAGVSTSCAALFGAAEHAVDAGWHLVGDNAVPGTNGLPSLRTLIGRGHTVLTF